MVICNVEFGRADREDVVGCFDQRVADAADVLGGRGADVVAEHFDLGLGFVRACGVP